MVAANLYQHRHPSGALGWSQGRAPRPDGCAEIVAALATALTLLTLALLPGGVL